MKKFEKANEFKNKWIKTICEYGIEEKKIQFTMSELQDRIFFDVVIIHEDFCCQILFYSFIDTSGELTNHSRYDCRYLDIRNPGFDTNINAEFIREFVISSSLAPSSP